MNFLRIAAFTALSIVAALAQVITPQGRLSLQSGAPVMTADASNASQVLYLPYVGNQIPIYNGSSFVDYTIPSGLDMVLTSTYQPSNYLYDLFVFLDGTTVTIGAGPIWASNTSRAAGGAISQFGGLWVNTISITLYNNLSSFTVPSYEATYVGSIYTTGNGETTVNLKPSSAGSGGNGNIIGIWNAYNRVSIDSISRDSTASWTNSSSSWVTADSGTGGGTSNSVTWLDGLQQTFVRARYALYALPVSAPSTPNIGLNLDSTTATPNLIGAAKFGTTSDGDSLSVEEAFLPQMGLHYIQAMERVNGSSPSVTFYGQPASGGYQSLMLKTEY